jgi:hypothetical protein
MRQRAALSTTLTGFVCLAATLATWLMPPAAAAGGVRLSIGIGIPAPVYVAPPPIVVHPAPVIVQPGPAVVYPPPVVYSSPYGVYAHPLPPVFIQQPRGYYPIYGYKSYKHGKHGKWGRSKHRHDD